VEALDGRFYAAQIQGDREGQEDDFGLSIVSEADGEGGEHTLMVLADGMGGHVGGAAASAVTIKTFIEEFQHIDSETPMPERLTRSLHAANDALIDEVEKSPELDGMGCTLVAASISEAGLYWVSVGDSPMWLMRDDRLIRLNEDHSMAPVLANLVLAGRMTEEEAAVDPRRNALRSAVSGEELSLIHAPEIATPLKAGDRILLASDGLETMPKADISQFMLDNTNGTPRDMVKGLIAIIEEINKPGQDNCTVLMYRPDNDLGDQSLGLASAAEPDPNAEVETVVVKKRRQRGFFARLFSFFGGK